LAAFTTVLDLFISEAAQDTHNYNEKRKMAIHGLANGTNTNKRLQYEAFLTPIPHEI